MQQLLPAALQPSSAKAAAAKPLQSAMPKLQRDGGTAELRVSATLSPPSLPTGARAPCGPHGEQRAALPGAAPPAARCQRSRAPPPHRARPRCRLPQLTTSGGFLSVFKCEVKEGRCLSSWSRGKSLETSPKPAVASRDRDFSGASEAARCAELCRLHADTRTHPGAAGQNSFLGASNQS